VPLITMFQLGLFLGGLVYERHGGLFEMQRVNGLYTTAFWSANGLFQLSYVLVLTMLFVGFGWAVDVSWITNASPFLFLAVLLYVLLLLLQCVEPRTDACICVYICLCICHAFHQGLVVSPTRSVCAPQRRLYTPPIRSKFWISCRRCNCHHQFSTHTSHHVVALAVSCASLPSSGLLPSYGMCCEAWREALE
jgi:hypothetical protein